MKLLHLGYAARHFDQVIKGFETMGYSRVHPEPALQPAKNIQVMKLTIGDVVVELMSVKEPSKPSFVDQPLADTKRDLVIFHLAYTVDDIEKTIRELEATGDFTLAEPVEIGGNGSCKYCYMQGSVVGLIELLQFL